MIDQQIEVYIGDGVFASFDGMAIRLRTPRPDGDHIIFLEYSEWEELKRFAGKVF